MLTLHHHKIKEEFGKSKPVLSAQLCDIAGLPQFLLQQKRSTSLKEVYKRLSIIKRISPFLLAALLLPVVFIFLLMVHGTINKWVLSFLFTCLEINILFTDFALWNYYEGKKILRIWLIEMFVIGIGVYFIRHPLF